MNDDEYNKIKALYTQAAEGFDPGDHEWVELLRAIRDLTAIICGATLTRIENAEHKKHWDSTFLKLISLSTIKDMAFASQRKPKFAETETKKPEGGFDA